MGRSPSTLLPARVTSTTSLLLSNTSRQCPSPPSSRQDQASGHYCSSHTTTPVITFPSHPHSQVTLGPTGHTLKFGRGATK